MILLWRTEVTNSITLRFGLRRGSENITNKYEQCKLMMNKASGVPNRRSYRRAEEVESLHVTRAESNELP